MALSAATTAASPSPSQTPAWAESQLLSRRLPLSAGLLAWDRESKTWQPYQVAASRLALINLWSVECGPCRAEMPTLRAMLAAFQKNFPSFGFLIVAETQDDRELFQFLRTHEDFLPKNTPILKVRGERIQHELATSTVPLTLLVDRGQVVRHAFVGSIVSRRSELVSAVERLSQVTE
ncbi:TlpA disulfide reductase family protein [Haliangium sp. UPWRP_2]|uniref:TlpA family protein disulfide reductase n=1 Tax=Haliangium sp. UPWRP_2 TaxID=1931276 RepID=UPI000B544262|nr:TlpA disulfide reductase family protein [Haliangium sp. UPWRP_2]PSM31486.1 TlpA family protein disulfide reductase [Haliangium sp. UPWRP_2]HNN95877.1 TlpA disulfide reductase family protein [Pseudomonadota bacterium]